jgi:hypothetical protein
MSLVICDLSLVTRHLSFANIIVETFSMRVDLDGVLFIRNDRPINLLHMGLAGHS